MQAVSNNMNSPTFGNKIRYVKVPKGWLTKGLEDVPVKKMVKGVMKEYFEKQIGRVPIVYAAKRGTKFLAYTGEDKCIPYYSEKIISTGETFEHWNVPVENRYPEPLNFFKNIKRKMEIAKYKAGKR